MKKIKIFFGLLIFALLFSVSSLSAQPGDPPDDGTGGDPIGGGGAPLGSGLAILMGFTAAYAGKKAYAAYKKEEED